MILALAFAVIAALFACAGQAGGVGYVALMGMSGYAPATIKTVALALTVLVSAIGVARYWRMGLIRKADWVPLAILGIPLSVAGGALNLPGALYRGVVAALLLAAGIRMAITARGAAAHDEAAAAEPPFLPALLAGGAVGLVAGLTGAGGGVFLAPLMLSAKWGTTRRVAAAAQVNNLYTGAAALAGVWATGPALPQALPGWALAAGIGGIAGAWLGAKHLPVMALRLILALILIASAARLALG